MPAQEFVEGGFRRAIVALQQVAVGRLIKLLGALFHLRGARRRGRHSWDGTRARLRRGGQDAVDFVFGGARRNGHRAELRALGLRWPLKLRPAWTRGSGFDRDLGTGRRQLAGASREGAHLLLHVLKLGSEGANLGLDAVEAARIGCADSPRWRGALPAAARTRWGGGAAAKRFERSHGDLHVHELLLELLDALAQRAVARSLAVARRCGHTLGGRRHARLSPAHLALRRLLGEGQGAQGGRPQDGSGHWTIATWPTTLRNRG